jgi:hypothetical protein
MPPMPQPNIAPARWRRARWATIAIVLLIVAARSAVFLLHPESYFDSDQAMVGLMAKHIAELRAFPLFMYGQNYLLVVEAWLAAPLFAIFGVSAIALKVPVLAMNGAIALLLVRGFERDLGLRPARAAVAAAPFVLPSVALSATFMDSSGGTLEPLLWVLLLWITRDRPLLCGLVFGVGFVNREFTIYGVVALTAIAGLEGRLFTAAGVLRFARIVAVAAAIWLAAQGLSRIAPGSGPGTRGPVVTASGNLAQVAQRVCLSPLRAIGGVEGLLSVHWPAVLGTAPRPLADFSIESRVRQGAAGASVLPILFVLLSIAGIVGRAAGRGTSAPPPRFAQYLVLVGLLSVGGYLFGRCGQISLFVLRYELLSVLGICGLAGWFLAARPPGALAAAWAIALALWLAVLLVPHGRLIVEYATDPPPPAKQQLIRALDAAGIRYGTADYWLSYYIVFMTNERMIFTATAVNRIILYNQIVEAHAAEAVTLSRQPCPGGAALIAGVYRCP